MNKKNGKNKDRRSQSSHEGSHENEQDSQPAGEPTPKTRKKLTVPERLVAKSNNIHELVKDILMMATFYGAGPEILSATHNLLVEADVWRNRIKTLVDEGWQPVVKGKLKDLVEGDKIGINAESKELYNFIPEDVRLEVGQIVRSENGRIQRVLLLDEQSLGSTSSHRAYGWAQLSHIERRSRSS